MDRREIAQQIPQLEPVHVPGLRPHRRGAPSLGLVVERGSRRYRIADRAALHSVAVGFGTDTPTIFHFASSMNPIATNQLGLSCSARARFASFCWMAIMRMSFSLSQHCTRVLTVDVWSSYLYPAGR